MKSEQQFIDEIYEKAEKIQKQQLLKNNRKRYRITIGKLVVVSALILILPASIMKMGQVSREQEESENFSPIRRAVVTTCIVEGIVEQRNSLEKGMRIQVKVMEAYEKEVEPSIEVYYHQENPNLHYTCKEGEQVMLFLIMEDDRYVIDEYGNGLCTYQGEQKERGRIYQKADGTLLYSNDFQ